MNDHQHIREYPWNIDPHAPGSVKITYLPDGQTLIVNENSVPGLLQGLGRYYFGPVNTQKGDLISEAIGRHRID